MAHRFNGAALVERGKGFAVGIEGSDYSLLQWGRAWLSAESRDEARAAAKVKELQWGRAWLSAERIVKHEGIDLAK